MFKRHFHSWLPIFVLALSIVAFQTGSAEAARRVALLIGNEKYEATSQLNNPANDVELMKTSFEEAGFDTVMAVHDLDRAAMVRALRDFEDTAAGADVAIIYYSGHGMEMNGQNFLLPVDVSLKTDKDVEDEAIPLDRVQRSLEGATRLKLVILDACRNNPFEQSMSRRFPPAPSAAAWHASSPNRPTSWSPSPQRPAPWRWTARARTARLPRRCRNI